ncbi:helix-turn-helix domain-containing protein [Georgenia sp. M64]|jgi:excisionase family DNA binding protein|uniref:helix-turn-helix domain-containing protein n=1 Tax=Georgenia sp. M64 TaxID=3120520 RepID=UPI0030E1BF2D
MAQRFLTLADVAEELAVSVAQVRVLVRSGELPAIQVGGRNQWRVEISSLEEYIQQQYARTRERIESGRVMDDSPTATTSGSD